MNIGTEASLLAFGETARAYTVLYACFTALGLLAALLVVLRAYVALEKPLHFYDWFALVEGAALTLAGTSLVFSAAHHERPKLWLSLAALWLIQAVFRLGFVMSLPSPTWLHLNEVLPTVLVCGAYGYIALQLSAQRKDFQNA